MNSTTGWAIVGAVILIVLALILLSTGRHTSTNTGEHPPNTTTQPERSTR